MLLEYKFENISLILQIVNQYLLRTFFKLDILKRFYMNDQLSLA